MNLSFSKTFVSHILVLVSISAAYSQRISGNTYAQCKQQGGGKIIYVYNEVFGFTENKESGVEGLLVDLMSAFEDYMKETHGLAITHEYRYLGNDFVGFMDVVKNGSGGVFGLGNISITEERKTNYSFSPAYLNNVSILVSNQWASTITKRSEISDLLGGYIGYTILNSTNDERLKQIRRDYIPGLEIRYLDSGRDVLNQLANANSFAILDLNFYLEGLSKQLPIKRHPVFDEVDVPFGIVMPRDSDWAPAIEEFFDSGFIKSNRYSEIISEHLGNSGLKLIRSNTK